MLAVHLSFGAFFECRLNSRSSSDSSHAGSWAFWLSPPGPKMVFKLLKTLLRLGWSRPWSQRNTHVPLCDLIGRFLFSQTRVWLPERDCLPAGSLPLRYRISGLPAWLQFRKFGFSVSHPTAGSAAQITCKNRRFCSRNPGKVCGQVGPFSRDWSVGVLLAFFEGRPETWWCRCWSYCL